MSAQSIKVEIHQNQVSRQKQNGYNLMLAKKVNGNFTVIWQSRLANAATDATYEQHNTFDIQVDSYMVGYTNDKVQSGSVDFTSGAGPVPIELSQKVKIDKYGVIGKADYGGTPGTIIIENELGSSPHEILTDSKSKPLFINRESGMDLGTSILTPQDEYQIWFQSHLEAGSIIVDNISHAINVVFGAGDTVKTVSFNADGEWQHGGLVASKASLSAKVVPSFGVTVLATFNKALTTAAITYLTTKLINKFSGNLRPKGITISGNGVTIEFKGYKPPLGGLVLTDQYEQAVDKALLAAVNDHDSELFNNSWFITEVQQSVKYD